MNNMSAKDAAFEKERAKYRRIIRTMEQENKKLLLVKKELNDRIDILEAQKREHEEWIERLLCYTELTREEMVEIIQEEKEKIEWKAKLNSIFGVPKHILETYEKQERFWGRYGRPY